MFRDCVDVFLEGDLLCQGRTDHLCEPAQVSRGPGGHAGIVDAATQEKRFETELGCFGTFQGVLACAGEVSDGLALYRRNVGRAEVV